MRGRPDRWKRTCTGSWAVTSDRKSGEAAKSLDGALALARRHAVDADRPRVDGAAPELDDRDRVDAEDPVQRLERRVEDSRELQLRAGRLRDEEKRAITFLERLHRGRF